jgi:BCD family chlorophyll transporter-like MFS transporter
MLNRVMIVELGLPASLVGLLFAIPLLISPVRVWLGYRSDAYPLWGLRREPYIVIGTLIGSLGVVGATLAALDFQEAGLGMALIAVLAFALYGAGKNLASNTYEALLADKFEGEQRPRAVTFAKVAMFVGIIGGAIMLGRLLDPFNITRLVAIVLGTVVAVCVISSLGIVKQEPRTEPVRLAGQEARASSFRETVRTLVLGDPQVRLFFIFVMLTVLGTLAQDVLLEPYGALVLNMSVAQTTRLTSIWGTGTIMAMLLAGMWLIKRYGYSAVLRVGLWLGVVTFIGLIATGAWQLPNFFMGLVFFLGVSTGLSAAGMLTAVIEFTTLTRAGLLMGVWGLAHEFGQACGSLFSGIVVDLGRALSGGNNLAAYGVVFGLEAVALMLAILLLNRVDLSHSVALSEVEPIQQMSHANA